MELYNYKNLNERKLKDIYFELITTNFKEIEFNQSLLNYYNINLLNYIKYLKSSNSLINNYDELLKPLINLQEKCKERFNFIDFFFNKYNISLFKE